VSYERNTLSKTTGYLIENGIITCLFILSVCNSKLFRYMFPLLCYLRFITQTKHLTYN